MKVAKEVNVVEAAFPEPSGRGCHCESGGLCDDSGHDYFPNRRIERAEAATAL